MATNGGIPGHKPTYPEYKVKPKETEKKPKVQSNASNKATLGPKSMKPPVQPQSSNITSEQNPLPIVTASQPQLVPSNTWSNIASNANAKSKSTNEKKPEPEPEYYGGPTPLKSSLLPPSSGGKAQGKGLSNAAIQHLKTNATGALKNSKHRDMLKDRYDQFVKWDGTKQASSAIACSNLEPADLCSFVTFVSLAHPNCDSIISYGSVFGDGYQFKMADRNMPKIDGKWATFHFDLVNLTTPQKHALIQLTKDTGLPNLNELK